MKTIGLLGGMSWESTQIYYRLINERIRDRLGGLHSARLVLYSVDFDDIERLQRAGDWDRAGALLAQAAQRLEAGGADFLVICTNTMHRVAADIEAATQIPLLHIADATAHAINAGGYGTVGLLGTRFTMEQEFYKGRLTDRHGIRVLTPSAAEQEQAHRIIYDELCLGIVSEASRIEYLRIVDGLAREGAQAVILGCTEIGMLLQQTHCDIPLFDTTAIHAESAADVALQ